MDVLAVSHVRHPEPRHPGAPPRGLAAVSWALAVVLWAAAAAVGRGGPPAEQTISAFAGVAPPPWFDPGNDATTGVGGGTFDLNAFLGADRYYAAGITGQNTISFNLEAGHFWNGHETLRHVATNATNFVHSADTFGGAAIAPKYDRHATWAAMLIGGRQTANPELRQQGIAHGTDLRSAAIATSWVAPAYALGFTLSGSSYVTAYDAAFGTAQVINSSYGYADPAGTNEATAFTDAWAFANPGTLHVQSAGNDGPTANTVGAPGSGYNGLTVAALGNANTFDTVAAFSSRGPQSYGYSVTGSGAFTVAGVRAAVDLAAPGVSITTAFYGGQTGGNDVNLQSSVDLGSIPTAYDDVAGTSFAAPLVAGGAALVSSAARTLPPLVSGTAAEHATVVKSLLLTAADKTAGWTNGQAAVTQSGTSFILTTQSLDWAAGAGRMNLDRTFDVQLLGQTDVPGTAPGPQGDVAALGWDLGAAQRAITNDYLLPELVGGSTFTATLSWMRNVSDTTLDDLAQANLDLSLWQLDGSNAFSTLVARSASPYNTVEHLHLELPAEVRYGLRVEYPGNSFDQTPGGVWGNAQNLQTYGLAWNAFAVPEPTGWILAVAGLAVVALRRRGRT